VRGQGLGQGYCTSQWDPDTSDLLSPYVSLNGISAAVGLPQHDSFGMFVEKKVTF
jgi:hypothetical protein